MDQAASTTTHTQWRSAFIRATLIAACVFGLVALVPSLFANDPVYQGVYTVLYTGILVVTFTRLNDNIKAGALIAILYAVAVAGITDTGIHGDGRLFMLGAITVASLLFSWRAGWVMLFVGLVTYILTGWLILTRIFVTIANTTVSAGTLEDWVTGIMSMIALSVLVIQGIRSTQTEFENSRERSLASFSELLNERASLENRILERTRSLDAKSFQLQAVAEVGKSIASYRNLSELLQRAAQLIHEHFGYYHVGVFLLDDRKEFAVLAASNSEGGKRMLEKKHALKVGETGIVGHVAENLRARIALDVGSDAIYFNNPDLPDTRSEMALPLIASGRILGILDVQSTEARAFIEEDIATIQILADQLAIAIQNANLFSETERALEGTRASYGQLSREAWGHILRSQARINYLSTPPATVKIEDELIEPIISKAIESGDLILGGDGVTISVPVKIRGQVIGALRLKKPDIADPWTQDETTLAISLADQLSGALESARLYRESQQRAARESLVSDISARISASATRDSIIRETIQELGQALRDTSVTFQLIDHSNGRESSGDPSRSANLSRNE